MQLKKLAVVFASLSLFSSFAHANILIGSNASGVCSKLPGTWVGDGKVEALSGLVRCDFHGVATLKKGQTDASFSMHINLSTSSAGCQNESFDLDGSCNNGNIVLRTDAANLSGNLTADGAHANIKGDVYFEVDVPFVGKETVDAKVTDMKLNKQ